MSSLRRYRMSMPLVSAALVLASQLCEAGSLYSSKGIGLWRIYPSGQGAGMGGVGIAFMDNLTINLCNPAARYPAGFTRVSTDVGFDFSTTTSSSGSASAHYGQASGFAMLIPLGKRATFSATLGPVSVVRYAAAHADTLPGYQFSRQVTGEGGLNQGEFSFFLMPVRYLYLGASAHLYFGRIRETWETTFSSTDFVSSKDRFSSHLEGFGGTFGVVLRPTARWNIGAVVSPPAELKVATDIKHAFRGSDSTLEKETRLPLRWGIGVAYQWPFGLTVGGDYYRQEWKEVVPLWEGRYAYANSSYLMIGSEFVPSRRLTDPYLKKVAYRAG
ncbi:MAG: hypothetical protein H5U38_01035, partial [Calditrichaeota bacterium]|nr:hypothetical protein [Calditrichota bacterium]